MSLQIDGITKLDIKTHPAMRVYDHGLNRALTRFVEKNKDTGYYYQAYFNPSNMVWNVDVFEVNEAATGFDFVVQTNVSATSIPSL